MSWLGYAILVAIGLFIGRTLVASRRLKEANARSDEAPAPTKKKKRKKKSSAAPTAIDSPTTPQIPSTWGWARVSLAAAELRALGYYYRDKQAGYSFKILVDLTPSMDAAAIREAARAKNYVADSTFRLGAHDTSYLQAMGDEMRAEADREFESGASPIGPHCAMVHVLTREQREAYGLPDAMPHIDVYL